MQKNKNNTHNARAENASVIGCITRVNGPVVEARGMQNAGMLEVVHVGEERLIGEIIRLQDDIGTVQVYEDTTGIAPGQPLYATGAPLSVLLGPGLLGNIYDGIQRPLRDIAAHSGAYIRRGEVTDALKFDRKWKFTPVIKEGDRVAGGTVIGTVQETETIEHRVMIPPHIVGKVQNLADEAEYSVRDTVCTVATDNGNVDVKMANEWPVREPRPAGRRLQMDTPLITGQRVIDTFFPIAKGGTAAIPGGFGTGKTMTQHALAKWADADIIVYVGCGERGNEMTDVLREFPELTDPRTGRSLMERTILVANTSNMPVAAREVSIYTGITFAEYYRDMGYDVAVMADSTSRWAEALRELSGRLEEMPADEGFPAYLPSRLAEFYERAGRTENLSGNEGSVSVIGAVSPPGGDFSEPVTQHTSRFIRCFWALDRDLANARHYPAISWIDSYSDYTADIEGWWRTIDPDWRDYRDQIMRLLQEEQKLQRIAKLVGPDALPDDQRLTLHIADLVKNSYLQQNSFDPVDMYCAAAKQVKMARILVQLWNRSRRILDQGGTLAAIREMPVIVRIVRMKSNIKNDDLENLEKLYQRLNQECDEVERRLS